MNNYLLSIGCNEYDSSSINNLEGAENDASNIFNCLVKSKYSIYNNDISKCLQSPRLEDIRNSLENILYDATCPDIFTLFFAGHGGIIDSTYYLLLKDSNPDRLSLSAISLSEIFRIISSSNIKHINLVIDACNTGGLVNDLMSIIKPDIIGKKGSIGVSILAAAASDEYAIEKNGEGVFTSNLINFINGNKKISSEIEYLDLVTLGKSISNLFNEEGIAQTPSAWGLNLYGPSVFAKNLFFNADDSIGIHNFSYVPSISRLGTTLESFKNELWKYYEDIDNISDYAELLHLMQSIFDEINDEDKIFFIRGVGYRFIEKIDNDINMKKLELINVFKSLLLPFLTNPNIKEEVERLTDYFKYFGVKSILGINEKFEIDKNFLICKNEMLSNYYFLPIRISKLLSISAQLLLLDKLLTANILELIDNIKKYYFNHFIVLNDLQAANLYIFFKVFSKLHLQEYVKDILENYIKNFLDINGNIAKFGIDAEDTFKYLFQRHSEEEIETNLLAVPSQTGSVFILISQDYKLDKYLNLHIHLLDRKNFLLFIPKNLYDFSAPIIRDGHNLILQCGLHFWTVADFLSIYQDAIKDKLNNTDELLNVCCIASSYIQPNRIPILTI
ncbi:caspase family protein [Sulfurimonas sp.]|uniref:caspase family protein n=1 Tax=Sulfurimonas sp. TaxID=2022749 RepID=UPI002AAFC246|nr:caspase family protein [Sulfurimonas sp.]